MGNIWNLRDLKFGQKQQKNIHQMVKLVFEDDPDFSINPSFINSWEKKGQ
ncbi:MAG: hypothetical protein CM15mL2_0170 [Caudoviricetes sp.]|nr:MAG: hypothetical protein CM15mL2_0170 [Caudoviricetes sp.]